MTVAVDHNRSNNIAGEHFGSLFLPQRLWFGREGASNRTTFHFHLGFRRLSLDRYSNEIDRLTWAGAELHTRHLLFIRPP
jgi:hypothetical protein